MRSNRNFLDKAVDNARNLLERVQASLPEVDLAGARFVHEAGCDKRPCWCQCKILLRDGRVLT
jgi:hypothetical protein